MFEIEELPVRRGNVRLRVARGHFATNHSHINYYIDISHQKTRLSEAKDVAKELAPYYNTVPVDTILCLNGTAVIGTCLADALISTRRSVNSNGAISVLEPEYNANSQIIFRDNMQMSIRDKYILVLMGSVTTGKTLETALDCIRYYGGRISGACAFFSAVDKVEDVDIHAIFHPSDVQGFASYKPAECPLCREHKPIDAIVNSFGYSALF
jgi:orotate phosphoribosyltransferase